MEKENFSPKKRESTHPLTTFQTATVQNYMYVTGVSTVSNYAGSFQLGQGTYDHLNQHCSKCSKMLKKVQQCSKRFNNAQSYPTFFFFFRFKECKILTKINNGQQMFNLSLLYQFCLRSKP